MKRTRYYTMNSWNNSTAPAYNLKVYNVIPKKYQDKVYELMDVDGFYDVINMLIDDFDMNNNYEWQAGFNGRSGGYLVLYRGSTDKQGGHGCYPGKHIDDSEVPAQVKKDFRRLALDIVAQAIYQAKNATIETYDTTVSHTRLAF